jgi:8-oxo-dGTP diphosphatase
MPETATLTADVVLFDTDDNVLLIRRGKSPFQGQWALPGGRLDEGETFLAAAIREAAEETGLDLAGVKLHPLGAFDAVGRDPRGRAISFAYTARITDTVHARAGDDAAELRWIDPDAALRESLAFDHAHILTDALDLLCDGQIDAPAYPFP